MLRKLKQQVTQAVNSVNPSEPQHEPLFNESEISSEGFLCPVCMHSFSSPDELQIHFQVHAIQQVGEQKLGDSSSFSLLGNGFDESNAVHLELNMKELRSQLQDEKHYSMELKKELDKLHGLIANQTEISKDEIPYLTQQVQMLEAATERMLEMEKETRGVNRQVEQLKQENSKLIKKIGELSTNVISKTDEIEEKNAEKALLGDELVRYRQEIQNLEKEIENLRKKLDQRPSEDDVSVLRKELVHAQQLMDRITQEKEEEIKKDIGTMHKMEQDRERLTYEIGILKSSIKGLENTIAKSGDGSKKLVEEIEAFRKVWEEKAANSTQIISNACKKIDDLEIIVSGYKRKIRTNDVEKNKMSELEDAKKSLLEISQENEKYKEELRQNKHALELAISGAREAEKQHINLQEKIMSLTILLNEQKQNYEEKVRDNQIKEMEAIKKEEIITEYRKEIEQLKKDIFKLKTSLTEASAIEDVLKQNLKEAKAKESLLMQKISEGNGAEDLAIEQMHKEKMALEDMVNELNEALKSLNIYYENAISKHEESWIEKIEAEEKKMKKLENELSKLHSNYVSAEEDNRKKLAAMLEEKMKTSEELNKIIETEHIKLKSAVERCTLMEEKARQLDNELHEKETVANRRNEEYAKLKETLECDLAEKEKISKEDVCQLQKALSICEQEKSMLKEQLEDVLLQFSMLSEECSKYKKSEVELMENINQKELLTKQLEEKINSLIAKLEYEKQCYDESIKDVQCKLNQMQQENAAVLTAKEKEIATQLKTISELNEKLCAKEKQLSDILQEMEKVHTELHSKEEERHILENKTLKLNRQNSELREEMDSLEKRMLQLKNDFEKETNSLKNSLEKCEKDKEESLSKLHVQLETEKNRLKEASKYNEEKNENLKQMKEDLNELRIVQRDLEKKKAEWLQEKRALQERCLTAESDLEFERERAIVNKRNFDDVQTAIRELGQVNQNLQMDFAKQISRKWLEDSEAINCRACDKPFTLTNRKHHCRQCGQIFCASCSSFTAKIASSRNPVRVCNACHEEIMHR
ncbi:FYVE zinc finger [Onchocerca flexuosa]|uniref:FYVE zinc finger n=2 Tax=Onchocerca flexuosa TaxID=387005 RepID=A0A238BWZ8_9BILA|nr:FYVE zinc finger [Onchocerca flexuosa]